MILKPSNQFEKIIAKNDTTGDDKKSCYLA